MQIMNPLKKLNSKLGGLVKLAGPIFYESVPGSDNPTDPKEDLEVQDMHDMTPDQQEAYALDNGGGNLKLPEYITNRYDKLPDYASGPRLNPRFKDFVGPSGNHGGLETPNRIDDPNGFFHGGTMQNPAGGPNNRRFNPYMDNIDPRSYSNQSMNNPGSFTKAFRSNSYDAGRGGVLTPYSGMVGNHKADNYGAYSDSTRSTSGGGKWSEFHAAPSALSRGDQRRLNAQFMLRRDESRAPSVSNAVGYKRRGNDLVMSDPVANVNNTIRKVRDIKGTPPTVPSINQPNPPPPTP